nr:AAA family ATPase [uncultured Blautia sp.]
MDRKRLPVGIDDFEKIRKENFYYIDKTGLIRELLQNWAEVNLITRPRRFGKSLNMSMLKSFFSVNGRHEYFEGLHIRQEKKICEEYMGKYPVVSISMKGIEAGDYETAFKVAVRIMNETAADMDYLQQSDKLSDYDKERYRELLQSDMDPAAFLGSLRQLTRLLKKYYNQEVIVLIDEYDVPLSKAFECGYYDQMVLLLRGFLGQALKTNENLKFAVLTGCMRISKESIFTGLNNLKVLSVSDVEFDEYYGFSDKEVCELLEYYGLSFTHEELKEWYDGYRFGNVEVYCPWDVICHVSRLCTDSQSLPQNYWINTSSNYIVRKFVECADNGTTRREIEKLIAGEEIIKEVRQELTYKEIYDSIENIWSVLYTTGYLTQKGKVGENRLRLAIPNAEIRSIFLMQIMELFEENVRRDGETLNNFCQALRNGDAENTEKYLTGYLRKTISIRDAFSRKEMKENFYHGLLIGILGLKEQWSVSSNRETGEGYSDILIETENPETGIIIEVKYAHDGNMETAARNALEQITNTRYEEELQDEGIENILKYGIAFYKKKCKVLLEK